MKDELLDLWCRILRDSLNFTNIPERIQHIDGRRFEDTEKETHFIFYDKLGLDDIKFKRVHKMAARDN